MATANDMTAKLILQAQATGGDQLRAMADEVRKLGEDAGASRPKFEQLATTLDDIANQQALIDAFRDSKRAVADLEGQLNTASAEVEKLAAEQERAAEAAAQAATAQADSARQLQAARDVQQSYRDAVAAARTELQQLREAGKTAMTPELAAQTKAAADQLKELQSAARQSREQVQTLAAGQKEASQAARETAAAQRDTSQAYERQVSATAQISGALGEQRRALEGTREAMRDAGIDAANLQQAQSSVNQQMERAQDQLAAVSTLYTDTGRAARQAGAEGQAAMQQVADSTDQLQDRLSQVTKAVAGLFAASKIKAFAADALHTADAFREMAERVRMASENQEEFERVQARLLNTAQATYRPLHEQQELYIRSADALRNLGYETEQLLDITDSFSFMLTTNAATGERAASAIDAFSRALQTGRIDARAWQTILAATPNIVDKIAESTGKSTEEIRKLGIDGKLALQDVTEALRTTLDATHAASEAMATTMQDALNNLHNVWGEFLRESEAAADMRDTMVGMLQLLADNLDTVAQVAKVTGAVVLGVFAARALTAVRTYVAELARAAVQVTAVGTAARKASADLDAASAAGKRLGMAVSSIGWAIVISQTAELVANLQRLRDAQKALEAAQAAEAETTQRLADRYAELSAQTGIVVRNMEELDRAVRMGLIVWDEAAAKYRSVIDLQRDLSDAVRQTADDLDSLAAVDLVGQFDALVASGTEVGEALQQVFDDLDLDRSEDIAAMERALSALHNTGRVQLQDLADAWAGVIERMDATQLQHAVKALDAAVQDYRLSAETAAQINETVLARSFELLGVNGAAAMDTISKSASDAIAGLDGIAEVLERTGATAEQTATALEMAFDAAVLKGDSLAAIDELEKRLESMAQSGDLSAAALERMRTALDRQRAAVEDSLPGIQSLDEAMRRMGVTSRAEMQRMADETRMAYEALRESGELTASQLADVWSQAAQAAIDAADGGMVPAWVKSEAAAHGYKVEVDAAGDATLVAADKTKKATGQIAEGWREAKRAKDEYESGGDGAKSFEDQTTQAHYRMRKSMRATWVDAATAASRYRQEAIAHAWELEGNWQSLQGRMILSWNQYYDAQRTHLNTLRDLAGDYARALEDVDARQRDLVGSTRGAASAVADLEMRLVELTGSEADAAKARLQRDQQNIQMQIELQRLEQERARIRGDDTAHVQAQREIELLERQLQLVKQVFDVEQKQAQQREQSGGQTGGSGGNRPAAGGGAGSQSGGMPTQPPAVNIELHAHGVTDPARLARMIEPELARLGRLAR